jgi:hypothetical protein
MAESRQAEVKAIESELENWFISRRFRMERAAAIRVLLDKNNFSGLSGSSGTTKEALLWKEIISGKPALDATLSTDAKLRKADTYMEIFDGATDNEHPCRATGMTFFRCLQTNAKANPSAVVCDEAFGAFDQCRSQIKSKQSEISASALRRQEAEDLRARSLFERRAKLLSLASTK